MNPEVWLVIAVCIMAAIVTAVIWLNNPKPSVKSPFDTSVYDNIPREHSEKYDELRFEALVSKWERQIEDILIEIMQVKSKKHLAIFVDASPFLDAWANLIERLRKVRDSDAVILIENPRHPFRKK